MTATGQIPTGTAASATGPGPALAGQTVVLIGGSAGIGLETARRARAEGAEVVLAARDADRLTRAAQEVGAQHTAAFDANDPVAVQRFFDDLLRRPTGTDRPRAGHGRRAALRSPARHERRSGAPGARRPRRGGAPGRAPGRGQDAARRHAVAHRRYRRPQDPPDLGIISAATAVLPPFTATLALELAPIRVNLIAAGFVDTPLSASLLGDHLEERRNELRATLPIGRVVEPTDVAALAVHIMTNTALTGATYDIDGGQQFVS
jgi:NAD(P)-dependent dehydrogenase (short-subunit alcohol dehydrogenase family)